MRFAPAVAADYRKYAEETQTFIQSAFWDGKVGRYHPAVPAKPKALPYDFMWGNGVAFSSLVGGARLDSRYKPTMEAFFKGLDAYWDKDAPIPGYDAYFSSPKGDDKYYDDNEWMVLTFAEAHAITGDKRYRERAEAAMRYVLSGWDDKLGGGIYWRQDHKSKNTCSNGPAATAALVLAAKGNRDFYVNWARRIVDWTTRTLKSPDNLFWDNINLEGRVEKARWTYNTALMLRANLGLFRFTREGKYLDEAKQLAQASEKGLVNPETNAFKDDALFSHLLVEAFLDLYETTHEPYLLARARSNADFAWGKLREPDGGFRTKWSLALPKPGEPKTLIANASVARMFWLLAAVKEK